ncbi:hypothetical protein GGR92_004812 [Spirosoma lacussanchae]|uniref:hypothetical protein n=1 Tax=Spirosoma lacussanchae TaxID=1884249 RepID=UPI0011099532|nr:hypothetical protein [Spirosoma lacussanchae]
MTQIKENNWTHDRLQAECYQWHVDEYPDDRHLVHANLNNSVGGRRGVRNTAIGIRKGRCDSQYFKRGRLYLFEFKVGSDSQKADQKAFQEANEREGAIYQIIRSVEQYKLTVITIRSVVF